MFQGMLDRFATEAPIPVLARLILGRTVSAEVLDRIFDDHSEHQYTRNLLFSSVFQLMCLVVFRVRPSLRAAYERHRSQIEVSLTSVYNKVNGIDLSTSQALVRETAKRMGAEIEALNGACRPWLEGYRIKVLDGNCIEATHHRIKVLRTEGGGALPGKSLAVYDPQWELVTDVFPCEDGHAQERSILGQVVPCVVANEVWIADRNFCVQSLLRGIHEAGAYFIIREHEQLPWKPVAAIKASKKTATGWVGEQPIILTGDLTNGMRIRRIRVKLKSPTRDGDSQLYILTNLPKSVADAATIADLYRRRWTIETAFQQLESHLHSEINTLGYPKAALFGFCVALVAFNVYAVIKAALRAEHGEQTIAENLSSYAVAEEVSGTTQGMMIAIDEKDWISLESASDTEFTEALRELVRRVNMRMFRKAKSKPRKPRTPRTRDSKRPHFATSRLLA